MRSTVPLKSVNVLSVGGGELDPLRDGGSVGGDCEQGNEPLETGVVVPGVLVVLPRWCSASDAARNSRLVVPRSFVDPERAEHTMATLL